MTTTSTDITRAQRITLLKHLVAGRDKAFVAQVLHITEDQVFDIARNHGYPDADKMRWAIDVLDKQADEIPTKVDHSITPRTAPRPSSVARPDLSVAQVRRDAQDAPPVVRPRTAGTSTAELLHQASESHKASTRNLGKKISGLLADLTQRLHDETADREAREAAAAEKAKKAKRIAELEAELARLKGKPAPMKSATTAPTSSSEVPAARIRAWASENHIECPAVGRVPAAVREAYDNAHSTAA